MSINSLTEVAWIPTNLGYLSPKDTLSKACDIEWPPAELNGFEVSSVTRFLAEFLAVVLQEAGWQHEPVTKVWPDAIDRAVARIGGAADVFDSSQPFFQRPRSQSDARATVNLESVFKKKHPVKKLSPAMPPDRAEQFWERSTIWPDVLALPEALLKLVTFHYFSPAGNNRYDGDKCQMGSPGFRFPGKDFTATEFIWLGNNLLETLLCMIPSVWVTDGGLPAWADRDGTRSIKMGVVPPLWAASWSSNAAVCYWDGLSLAAASVGGVPPAWIPTEVGKKEQKTWWDLRNLHDPFYFYRDQKMVRLDLGRNETDLIVDWHCKLMSTQFQQTNSTGRVSAVDSIPRLMILRHRIGGTGSSPVIRDSKVMIGDKVRWLPDGHQARSIMSVAAVMQKLHWAVVRPFREMGVGDTKMEEDGRGAIVLPTMANQREDVSNQFWHNIADTFEEAMTQGGSNVSNNTWREVRCLTMKAFDEVVTPAMSQLGPRLEYVRAWVERDVGGLVAKQLVNEEDAHE